MHINPFSWLYKKKVKVKLISKDNFEIRNPVLGNAIPVLGVKPKTGVVRSLFFVVFFSR